MNTLILNGGGTASPFGGIAERVAAWARTQGSTVSAFDLAALEIAPCRGCFECWIKTPGLCVTRDAMAGVLRELAESEFVAWITPVTFGGYGYHLKKALDRSIPILLPFFIKVQGEVHHPHRYELERRLAVLGTLPSPDPETEGIFHRLVARNALNMQARPLSLVLYENADNGRWENKLDAAFASSAAAKEARP